jgi:ketosteroid isomerase-like protein
MHRLLLVLLALAAGTNTAAAALGAAQESLANAEREFAAAGLRDGVRKSFLDHFADDATVLKPFAIPAKAFYSAQPDRPGQLHWAPQYVAVSAAGDLGLSTGPWRFAGERDGKPVAADGHFLSVWQRERNGRWQVLFDHGIGRGPNPAPVESTPLASLAAVHAPNKKTAAADAALASLSAADGALRTALAADVAKAYAAVAGARTLWLRDGSLPQQSAQPPTRAGGDAVPCGCGPRARIGVATSADFGYTIGGSAEQADKGIDVRIWQLDAAGAWRLLADLTAAAQ